MNNTVRNYRGDIIGFRCFSCSEIKDKMWGVTCNECRKRTEENKKLLAEITLLREEVKSLKDK